MQLPSIYRDNVLIEACGPLLDSEALTERISLLPPRPVAADCENPAFALHETQRLHDLFVPSGEMVDFAETLGMLARSGYRCRNPSDPSLQAYLRGRVIESVSDVALLTSSLIACSGQGKTATSARALLPFAQQVVVHEKLPGFEGPQKQLVYMRVETPPSGTLDDVAFSLMQATDRALDTSYFTRELASRKMDPAAAFRCWLHYARLHHVGVIVFDEFQNLLKLTPKKERAAKARASSSRPDVLTIVQDKALQEVISISNAWRIPCVFAMTPDGKALFSRRFGVSQRLAVQGARELRLASGPDDEAYMPLITALGRYQYLPEKVTLDEQWRQELFSRTAYVRRILVGGWCQAQRLAIRKRARKLELAHFWEVMDRDLAPVAPAVAALLAKDPEALSRYHDVLPPAEFWNGLS